MANGPDRSPFCPICGGGRCTPERVTRAVEIVKCRGCGHRVATHTAGLAKSDIDYHQQYDEGGFLDSLEETRRRQGKSIARLIRDWLPDADGLVDVGSGRGWFLDSCRAAGFQNLAGADTSPLALQLISNRGYAALEVPAAADGGWSIPFERLPFRPNILTFLDVIEHLPAGSVVDRFTELVSSAGSTLKLVVVKVPSSNGILYRLANLFSRLGFNRPLDQLYQAGSDPPHSSYFSPRSLIFLLKRCGFEVAARMDDRDFEPGNLAQRLRGQPAFFSRAATVAGYAIQAAGGVAGCYDSVVVIARPLSIAPCR
jgi:hypothetical protein